MFKIADSHNDFLTKLPPERVRSFLCGEVRECSVSLLTGAVCCSGKPHEYFTAQKLIALTEPLRDCKDTTVLIELEGLDFLTQENLNLLDALPLFAVTLTWNNDNALAGGCRGGSNMGLTPFGRALAKLLQEKNIAADTAHLGRKSFYELIDLMPAGMVYNSHTCIADLFTDDLIMERNITAEQAGLIIERGGFVGITLIPYFLRGQETEATAEDVFRHIDFLAECFGAGNIGIGSDFFGATHYPQGISDYYGYHSIIKVMEKHGYTSENIKKILFDNFNNFYLSRVQ